MGNNRVNRLYDPPFGLPTKTAPSSHHARFQSLFRITTLSPFCPLSRTSPIFHHHSLTHPVPRFFVNRLWTLSLCPCLSPVSDCLLVSPFRTISRPSQSSSSLGLRILSTEPVVHSPWLPCSLVVSDWRESGWKWETGTLSNQSDLFSFSAC